MKSESQQMHLDDLCHAIREFTHREGLEKRSVDEDILGLPERADEVLAVQHVDRSLSAHTRVDHCEQSHWDLHEMHAAHAACINQSIDVSEPACTTNERGRGGIEENAQGRGDKANQIAKRKNHGVACTFIQYEHQGCSRLFLNRRVGRAGQQIFGR